MVSGYVLINVKPSRDIQALAEEIHQVNCVKEAHAVAGPYDIVVLIESVDFNNIVNTVIKEIRGMKGIANTVTLYIVT